MNRTSHILPIIALLCGSMPYAIANSLYTTGTDTDPVIEVSQDSFLIARNETVYSDITEMRLYARCQIRHIADSFYSIWSDPYKEKGFKDPEITVRHDPSLDGRTRVAIYARNLYSTYGIKCFIYGNWRDPDIVMSHGRWIHDFDPPRPNRQSADTRNSFDYIIFYPTCPTIFSHSFDDRYLGLMEYTFYFPKPVDLSDGNRCVTITFPNLDDSAFSSFYLNEIIVMTDDYLKWDGRTYYRSAFNSYSEFLDHIQ